MLKIILQVLTISSVCLIEIYSNDWYPQVWPETFVDEGKPFVEFTCGAFLKSREWLSWYTIQKSEWCITTIQQSTGEEYRTIKLLWPVASLKNDKVYCRKDNGSITKSKLITIESPRNIYPQITSSGYGPWLVPATFVDDGTPVFEFASYAYLFSGEYLSCYQKKATTSVYKLGMVQQETKYGYVKIRLQKTLEASDNGSQIYCSRQHKSNHVESNLISITFHRHIEALEPYVTVEPSTDVVFFDEGDAQEFVCSGSAPVDGRVLTWYLQSPVYEVIPPDQTFHKRSNQNHLTLSMDVFYHEKLLYCAQDFTYKGSYQWNYGELARSRTIILLHRPQCKNHDQPRVFPETFVDERKKYIQFTCYAFLETGQLLSWYQSKGLTKPDSLLRVVQLQEFEDPKSKRGEWTVLTLNKTLEQSDNGTDIYCEKQSVLADGIFSDAISRTKRIPIEFQREIPTLGKPYIRVEPTDRNVTFAVNATLRLTCSGSKPLDGRNYTWFRKDANSSITVPKEQKYDPSTNLNVLDLSLNESYHMAKLFCAQGFVSYIRQADGTSRLKIYGELQSETTTLIQEKDRSNLILLIAVPLLLVLVASVACLALCRRRRGSTTPKNPTAPATQMTQMTPAAQQPAPALKDNTDDLYMNVSRRPVPTAPEVTYAELDLQRPTGGAHKQPVLQNALYAEVSRVCKK